MTLIELMISLVIGLLVLGALLVVYLGSRAAYLTSDSLARVQESGRFAVEFIAQDARMSGFVGCRSRNLSVDDETLFSLAGKPGDPNDPPVQFSGGFDGVRGFDGSNAASIAQWKQPTGMTRVGSSDVLTIRRAGGAAVGITGKSTWVTGTGGAVTLRHNAIGVRNDDIVALGNCNRAVVFRVTNSPALTGIGNHPTVLEFKASGGGSGGAHGNDTSVPFNRLLQLEDDSRAQATGFAEISYFIGENAAKRPSLFRAAGGAVEELVENVEDMDIVYGLDTTPPPDGDGVIELYRRADQIAAADWGRVVSARISLLVVSPLDPGIEDPARNVVTTNLQTYFFRETNDDGRADEQTAPDRRLRHVFTTTISLRNRAP